MYRDLGSKENREKLLTLSVPDRSGFKTCELAELMKLSREGGESLYEALLIAYNLGYQRASTRAKNEQRKTRRGECA